MTNPDPIQQNIKVTADTSGADETVQSLDEVRSANDSMVAAAEKAAERNHANTERARTLAGALGELQREELAYQAALDGGAEVSDEAAQAASGRRTEIDRLAAELAGLEDEQDRVNKAVRESVNAHRASEQATSQAARAERSRDQIMAGYRNRLEELAHIQHRYEQTTKSGTRATDAARRSAERRERQMRRLGTRLQAGREEQDRVNASVRRFTGESSEASSGVELFTKRLTGMAAGVGAIGLVREAWQLLRNEIEQANQAASEAFETQKDLASAQRGLKLNLADVDDAGIARAIEAAGSIAQDTSVSEAVITLAMADALSSVNSNIDRAIANTWLAAQVRPDAPSQIKELAGGIGDIQGAIGTDDPEVALGFLLQVQQFARISDFSKLSTSAPPAIKDLLSKGFDAESAGSIFSAITAGSADRTGESSRTASIQFGDQLRSFLKDTGNERLSGVEGISLLRQDESLRKKFLEDLSIESRAKTTVESFLIPGRAGAVVFDSNLAAFGDQAALDALAVKKLRQLGEGPQEANAQLDRDLEALTNHLQAVNIDAAAFGAIQDNLDELLRATGSSDLASKIKGLELDLKRNNSREELLGDMVEMLEEGAEAIRRQAITSVGRAGARGFKRKPLNTSQRAAIETIHASIRKIQERRGLEVGLQFIEAGDLPFGQSSEILNNVLEPDIPEPEIDDPNLWQADPANPQVIQQPGTIIQNQFVNHGTVIEGAGHFRVDDAKGSDRE